MGIFGRISEYRYYRCLFSMIHPITILERNSKKLWTWKLSFLITLHIIWPMLSGFLGIRWRIIIPMFVYMLNEILISYHIYTFVLVPCLATCTNICMPVCVRMKCFYKFKHVNANEPFSPFVPFDSCWKTASRAIATNVEASDATNDEANMWLVHSSFASPLTRMCKCGIRARSIWSFLMNHIRRYLMYSLVTLNCYKAYETWFSS